MIKKWIGNSPNSRAVEDCAFTLMSTRCLGEIGLGFCSECFLFASFNVGTFILSKSRMTVGSDHLKLSFTSPRKGVNERTQRKKWTSNSDKKHKTNEDISWVSSSMDHISVHQLSLSQNPREFTTPVAEILWTSNDVWNIRKRLHKTASLMCRLTISRRHSTF